ncbi:MAG: hypothetical protein A2Y71_15865 [Bacteroidetes bacterium RBG_13_42_15]|nr:MAG: hypothetical protein A2Y71_15865 [Bacteroidetes bacterium RBG_13_42_15]
MRIHDEIIRKGIHFLAVIIPVAYIFLPKQTMLLVTGSMMIVAFLIEGLRQRNMCFNQWFNRKVGHLLRLHEKSRITGATYLITGCFFSLLFFDKWIAQLTLLFVIISDGFSALVSRLYGWKTWFGDKTVLGAFVFLLTGVAVVFIFFEPYCLIGIAGALTALIVELSFKRLNDNLAIPIFSGLIMQILFRLSG